MRAFDFRFPAKISIRKTRGKSEEKPEHFGRGKREAGARVAADAKHPILKANDVFRKSGEIFPDNMRSGSGEVDLKVRFYIKKSLVFLFVVFNCVCR